MLHSKSAQYTAYETSKLGLTTSHCNIKFLGFVECRPCLFVMAPNSLQSTDKAVVLVNDFLCEK